MNLDPADESVPSMSPGPRQDPGSCYGPWPAPAIDACAPEGGWPLPGATGAMDAIGREP